MPTTLHRPLHIIDFDNLSGDPRITDPSVIRRVFDTYRASTNYQAGDHAVVGTGCNAKHAFAVQAAWPQVRHVRRRGADGADFALVEAAIAAAERDRYSHFILASGDHSFVPAYEHLSQAGFPVFVASRPEALSRTLKRTAGSRVVYLPRLMPM